MFINGFTFWGLRKSNPLPPPDIMAFMEFIRRGRFPDEYTADERYADFRRVFMSDPVGRGFFIRYSTGLACLPQPQTR